MTCIVGKPIAAVAAALLIVGSPLQAQRYTLFNPVPKDSLRDLNPDRPDRTEGPFTIDAGHYQLETEVFNQTKDGAARIRSIGGFNLKVGIVQSLDLELITQASSYTSYDLPMYISQTSSFPDLTLRGKINFWGNDGGRTALGLIALVTVPARTPVLSSESSSYGLILPLNVNVGSFGIAVMSDLEIERRDLDRKRVVNTIHSVSVSRSLSEKLGGYLELAGETVNEGSTTFLPTFDAGVMWTATRNLQFDLGSNFGLNDKTPKYSAFFGFSVRH